MRTSKKTLILRITIALVLAIGGILYALADRYLIEHVEIANVSAASAQSLEATATDAETATPGVPEAKTETAEPEASETAAATATPTTYIDDWNYQGGAYTITIKQVTTGSGNDAVTYFVADVVLTDATQLASAFAKDSFGQNIIEYTSAIAAANDAIFAINGDYYGFRDDGIIIRNGVIFRDLPARTGLAFYTDGTMRVYDETQTSAEALLAAGVWNTLSFGPALIDDSQIVANLDTVEVDTNFGNHSIQGSHPRTGIGIIDANHFVFVVVDGRERGYSRGVTLAEFAQIFASLGAVEAYNIDGGGSSTMYFNGRVVNNPLGENKERGTSDILFIGQ